jgi:protein-S-isoprenylcysteine O-methyltransferase Ste14
MLKVAGLTHHLLLTCFYVLVVALYFLRSSAVSTARSWVTKAIALLASFLPFALPILSRDLSANAVSVVLGNLIMISGMAFSIYALLVLGKSFSIIPQARGLVQSGPYRLIRHPLYVGEFVGMLGAVLARLTVPAIGILFLLAACQVYRSLKEEELLGGTFPEYKSYCRKTARFIPGVF